MRITVGAKAPQGKFQRPGPLNFLFLGHSPACVLLTISSNTSVLRNYSDTGAFLSLSEEPSFQPLEVG